MTRPPALGPHARHRPLGTPGPTGCNDHGDPGHRRRLGITPGPLGYNDYCLPAPIRRRPVDIYDDEVAMMVNDIIEQADRAMGSAAIESKLQYCIDLAKQNSRDKEEARSKYRDAERYFQARNGAFNRTDEFSEYLTDHAAAWVGGSFDRSWGWSGYMPSSALHPGADRVGKWSRHDEDQPVLGPYDGALRWAAKGAADRLRDDHFAGGALQPHSRPAGRRTVTAFPRTLTD